MDEAFYTDILDAMSDGAMVFGHDKRITFCNQAFLDITGFGRDDLDHAFSAIIQGADTDPKAIAAIDGALFEGTKFDGEILSYRKSGEPFWSHLVIKPVTDSSGRVSHFIATLRDVTADIRHYPGLEQDYEFIFENVLAGIIIHAPDSRIRFINRKAREMLGLTGNSAIDRTAQDLGWKFLRADGSPMPPEELPFRRALQENKTVRGILLGRTHPLDGEIVWAMCDAFLAKNDAGKVTAVLVSFTDVSRLIESERYAHAYRERFELAVRASQDVIFEWNIETGEFSANEAFKNVYGYDPPGIMGPENLDPRNRAEDSPFAVRDIALEAIASGTDRFSVDHLINRPDGSTGHVAIRAFIVRNSKGEATRVIGTATDIGRLTAALTALEDSETRFRIIADTVSDVLWDNNFDTGQLWMTPGWASKLGVPEPSGPLMESHWRDLISPADIDAAVESYNEALNSQATHWETEYRMVSADGRTIDMAVKARILRHSDGRAYRVLGSVRDVTALKLQQEGYTRARALQAVGQLTGGIAHDFNNLLMIIIGNAELLEMSTLSDTDAECVALINQAAENAATLTKRLLAFSGQTRLNASSVDMLNLLDHMWPLLRAALPESISVTHRIAQDVWETNVDANGLEQAILNLAMNAKDAMPNGGQISIACKNHVVTDDMVAHAPSLAPGRYVILSFSDNGLGMSEDVLSKALEPFFTTKEFGKGTGLGLSTVYGFVTQSGGDLTIQSEAGRGTTVNLYLTASQGPDPHRSCTDDETKDEYVTGQHRILAVEDQPEVRAHVENLLTRLGYSVVSASDASSALDILNKGEEFDLLFTDIVMPGGMNGLELSKAAEVIAPKLRILYTSGYPAAVYEDLGVENQGNVNILGKPYKAKQLQEAIAKALYQ